MTEWNNTEKKCFSPHNSGKTTYSKSHLRAYWHAEDRFITYLVIYKQIQFSMVKVCGVYHHQKRSHSDGMLTASHINLLWIKALRTKWVELPCYAIWVGVAWLSSWVHLFLSSQKEGFPFADTHLHFRTNSHGIDGSFDFHEIRRGASDRGLASYL